MYRAAQGAFFVFAVLKPHFPDMSAAAGYFDADDGAVAENVYPVVIFTVFILVVHGRITP